jgi:hypothetical protein
MSVENAPTALIGAQLSWAIIASYAIEYTKKLEVIPWVNYETQNLNRLVSMLVAAATSSGLAFIWNRQAGSLLITGISLSAIYHFISQTIQQYALQHAAYKALIAPSLPGPVQDVERKNGHAVVAIETHGTNSQEVGK